MKVKSFMSLLIILGVTVGLSGVTFGQEDTIATSITTTPTVIGSQTTIGSNTAGDSASHILHLTFTNKTADSEIDTIIVFFPYGTRLDTTIETVRNQPDTLDPILIDGAGVGAITGFSMATDTLHRPEQRKDIYENFGLGKFASLTTTDSLRPYILFDLDASAYAITGTSTELYLNIRTIQNDTTLGTSPRRSGSGYKDIIGVWMNNAAKDTMWVNVNSYIETADPYVMERTTDFTATTTTHKDTCGMAISWGKAVAALKDSLVVTVKDIHGNVVLDSTGTATMEFWNTTYNSQNPGNGKILVLPNTRYLGGYNIDTSYTSVTQILNNTEVGDGVGVAIFNGLGYSYSKATYVRTKVKLTSDASIYVGSASSPSTTLQFVNHRPKLLTFSPAAQTADVEVNSSTSVFTASVSDSFGNVCTGDSLSVWSYFGTGTIYSGTSASAVTSSLGPEGGIDLDNAGKAYFKMVVGTDATEGEAIKDSIIIQTVERRMHSDVQGSSTYATEFIWNTNLRKAIAIDIIAGEAADVVIYPTVTSLTEGDLTDQTSTDYYDGTYGDQGRVRVGSAIIFVAKLTDQFANPKGVSSSFAADSITWSMKSGSSGGGSFAAEGVSSTIDIVAFSVDVDTVIYTTSTTIDTDTVYVTVNLPSGVTKTETAPFYTKGGLPAQFMWLPASSDTVRSSSLPDTMRVDSVIAVKAYMWDAWGNVADTAARVTFGVGYQSVVGTGNATNEGLDYTITHTLAGAATFDTLIHNLHTPGSALADSVYGSAYFNSDSAKGYTYVYVKVGASKLDSIKILKATEPTYSIALVMLNSADTETDVDTAIGAIVAGSTREMRVRLYDLHDNLVVPDTMSGRNSLYHPGALFTAAGWKGSTALDQTVIAIDTVVKDNRKGGDSSYVAKIGDTDGDYWIVHGGYNMLDDDAYIQYTLRTLGGKADFQKVGARFIGLRAKVSIGDTILFRTTLPDVLSYFAVWVEDPAATVTSLDVSELYTLNLSPKDVGGNPIYALGFTKFELHLLDSDGAALTFDTTKSSSGSANLFEVVWSSFPAMGMKDSTNGIAWTEIYDDSVLATGDSTISIKVTSTKVLTGAKVRLVANTENLSAEMVDTFNLALDWDADELDTIEVAPVGATTTLYEQTMFDLGVAYKDKYRNRMADSVYALNVFANHSNVSGIGTNIVVKDSAALKVVIDKIDHPANIQFFAQATQNPINSHTVSIFGFSDMYTVSSATIGAPSGLNATDVAGDAGGYVELSWTPSANHPGMTGTTDDNLAISYYQIYRNSTDAIATATLWGYVLATPLTGTTVKTVVSTNGITSAAYYWVAAVKGDLPVALSTSTSGTAAAKVAEFVPAKTKEAAVVSASYAVMSSSGSLISVVSNSNRATATSVAQAAVGDYDGSGAVGLDDVLLTLEVMGDTEEFDAVFDFDSDGKVGLDDILNVLGNLGTTVGKVEIAPKMGDASIEVNNSSEGDVVDLSINLENAGTIKGYGFVVTYNAVDYEFVDAIRGAVLSEGYFLTNDSKPGRLVVANVSTEGVEDGTGHATNLRFQWISEEISPITIANISTMNDENKIFDAESKVIESPVAIPKEFALKHNYPNPFNPTTTIKVELPKTSDVRMEIYNVLGQKVKTLVNKTMKAGYHKVVWDGRNDYGTRVSSGMYIYIIKAGDFIAKHKMVLLK